MSEKLELEKNVSNGLSSDALAIQVGANLLKLIKAVGWSQAKFAGETGISTGALSGYISGDKIPSLFYLVNICAMKFFKEKGLDLTLDKLIMENFNPALTIQNRAGKTAEVKGTVPHGDFIGNYVCYFFDQSKPTDELDNKASRGLRYGVISIFDDYNALTGKPTTKAVASFFKEEEAEKAFGLKGKLDDIFSSDFKIGVRNTSLMQEYEGVAGYYNGVVTFSDRHAFISVESEVYGDNALLVLYSPQKKTNVDYIGGIGSVASISHGRNHMPTAQKIIISKYKLGCSNEMIAEHLSMATANISQQTEAEDLAEFCRKLYSNTVAEMSYLDEFDKIAMIQRRMRQLVKNYVEKNVCCVCSVSEDEDKKVLALIRRYAD